MALFSGQFFMGTFKKTVVYVILQSPELKNKTQASCIILREDLIKAETSSGFRRDLNHVLNNKENKLIQHICFCIIITIIVIISLLLF